MYTNDNMLSNENISKSDIKNKGFTILDSIFKKNAWTLTKNETNWMTYTKLGDETSYFDIKISQDKIVTSVPIKGSQYQFVTSFKSYYEASEFIEQKLFDYIN